MPKTKPPYPAAFRQQMIELVHAGKTPAELSREFECSAQTILNWVAQAARDEGRPLPGKEGLSSAEREELAQLRRQVRQLQMERDILANRPRGAPLPRGKKHLAPTLLPRRDSRPLAFWRLMTP